MNMKGGVGKTTLAVEVSRTLAHNYDKNVLLIDYDPQANASYALLETERYVQLDTDEKTIAHCLMPGSRSTDPFSVIGTTSAGTVDIGQYIARIRRWYYPHDATKKAGRLDLVPGALDLMRLALNVLHPDTEKRLLSRWNELLVEAKKNYECIIIDCHPAGSFFTKSALLSSSAVIIPVTADAYAATGLQMMRQHMEMWQSSGGVKEFLVVFNDAHQHWDSSVESQIRANNRFADQCLSTKVRYSTLLRNLANRRRTSAEQRVPYSRKVSNTIAAVSTEIVDLLRRKNIFDSTW